MGIGELVRENGYSKSDIDSLFEQAKQNLASKEEFDGRPAGQFVTVRQSNWDYKLIVLQELLGGDTEVKIAYYTVQEKALREDGQLKLQWANRPPSMAPEDLENLVGKAQSKGIL